jgi:hypothetical protein
MEEELGVLRKYHRPVWIGAQRTKRALDRDQQRQPGTGPLHYLAQVKNFVFYFLIHIAKYQCKLKSICFLFYSDSYNPFRNNLCFS